MKINHRFGYLPSPPDTRDNLYPLKIIEARQLPEEVDLRPYCSPVSNQGNLGSCTGFATADGLREFLYIKGLKEVARYMSQPLSLVRMANPPDESEDLSPLWVYQQELIIEGKFGIDAGAILRDGMKVLLKLGVPREVDWPYDISKFATRPPITISAMAEKFKIKSYHRLYTSSDLKSCLADGYGAVAGFIVRDSFSRIKKDGRMPMPAFWERSLGGHAIFFCGYRNDRTYAGGGYWIVKNSWGKEWGDNGYFYMPFAYLKPWNVLEIWTAR